jgi:hypothetical protein
VGPGTTISAPGGGACKTPDNGSFTCTTDVATRATNANFWVGSTILYGITTPTSANTNGSSGPTYGGAVGTSMAAPHVSGVAALLLSRMPSLTPDEVTFIIASSARPHPAGLFCAQAPAGTCGSGMLDASAAVTRLSDRMPMLTAAPSVLIVSGGEIATLTASATPRNGGSSTFTYAWTQTAGPPVLLSNTTTASASFVGTNPGGTQTFRAALSDGNGYRVTQSVTVRSNNPPTMTPVTAVTVARGSTATINVTATDPENDTLTYVATNLPTGATFSAATGQFNWPSIAAATGTYTFDVFANDSVANSPTTIVVVNVADSPPAPSPTPTPPVEEKQNSNSHGAISELQILGLLAVLSIATYLRRRRGAKPSRLWQ